MQDWLEEDQSTSVIEPYTVFDEPLLLLFFYLDFFLNSGEEKSNCIMNGLVSGF